MELAVGDILKMKKEHPCGSGEWEVLRAGADFRIKCCGCGHQVMLPRKAVEKNLRHVVKSANADNGAPENEGEA